MDYILVWSIYINYLKFLCVKYLFAPPKFLFMQCFIYVTMDLWEFIQCQYALFVIALFILLEPNALGCTIYKQWFIVSLSSGGGKIQAQGSDRNVLCPYTLIIYKD